MVLMLADDGAAQRISTAAMADTILAQAHGLGRRIAILVHDGSCVQLVTLFNPTASLPDSKIASEVVACPVEGQPSQTGASWAQQLSQGLQQVDRDPVLGLRLPVIVLGSAAVACSLDVRSDHRAVTHIIAFYAQAQIPAAMHHLLMHKASQARQASAAPCSRSCSCSCPHSAKCTACMLSSQWCQVYALA